MSAPHHQAAAAILAIGGGLIVCGVILWIGAHGQRQLSDRSRAGFAVTAKVLVPVGVVVAVVGLILRLA